MQRKQHASFGSVCLALFAPLFFVSAAGADAATIGEAQRHIRHIIIIMQENRSFDSYFGTFPGADGLPTDANGKFKSCVPLSVEGSARGCVRPFHDTSLVQSGGPHDPGAFVADDDNGKMDGFVQAQIRARSFCREIQNFGDPLCVGIRKHDVMGYHTAVEIPNYWTYAKTYMLQDHLYESISSYSLPAHLMMVSEWSARCKSADPMSCKTDLKPRHVHRDTPYSWTSLSWLLDLYDVSWKYYLSQGGTPDCDDQSADDVCDPEIQNSKVFSIWNPLPGFVDFEKKAARNSRYADHVTDVKEFYKAVATRNLPAVSWIVPNSDVSEHPPGNVVDGMDYVTSLVNTVMQSAYYDDTVIFIAWDDWGGFYDHENPPVVSLTGKGGIFSYGFRVPGLIISPYVEGHFDHQTLSFDAYNRLIEDVFLDSQRLDPRTDGRPDSRPEVYEALTEGHIEPGGKTVPIGNLLNDFDFKQKPIPPMVLSNQVPNQ